MPTFTSGRVSALPMQIETKVTLGELRSELAEMKPNLSLLRGGWASISDTGSNLNTFGIEPPESEPELVAASEDPEHLMARYYFWEKSSPREKALPEADYHVWYQLKAVDAMITQVRNGALLVVFSTRTRDRLAPPRPKRETNTIKDVGALVSLEQAIRTLDPFFVTSSSSSALTLGTPDFFLWLMRCWHEDKDQNDISLTSAVGLKGEDQVQRGTVLQQAVDFERVGFLTSVAEGDVLGPVSISFRDAGREATLDIEIWIDGGFVLHRDGCHYPTIHDEAELRIRAVRDLVFRYVPSLRDSYEQDEVWTNTRRATFITEATHELSERYAKSANVEVNQECPHCGVSLDS